MKTTIYLPDDLAKRLEDKLARQSEDRDSLSKFIQRAVEKELAEKDISEFLSFAGAVKEAPLQADEEAEDFLKFSLVIDSGPLIATLFEKDRYHTTAIAGFQRLQQEKWRLIVPLPIVFEVYRWLLQHSGAKLAQDVLLVLDRSFEIYYIQDTELTAIKQIALYFPNWLGTLADASVVYIGMQFKAPVWTLDYRDLGVFNFLEFWHP